MRHGCNEAPSRLACAITRWDRDHHTATELSTKGYHGHNISTGARVSIGARARVSVRVGARARVSVRVGARVSESFQSQLGFGSESDLGSELELELELELRLG